MFKTLTKNTKSVLATVSFSALSLGTAMAQSSDIQTAMEAIKTDATANVGIMLPIGIAILGVIIGATIAIVLFKKITGKIG